MKNGKMAWVTVTDRNVSEIEQQHLPMNRSLLKAAYRYGATIESCSSLNLFRSTVNGQTEYIQGTGTSLNSLISRHISKKKQITNFLLDDMGVIPDWCMLTSDEYTASGISHIDDSMFPVVVKPTNELHNQRVGIMEVNIIPDISMHHHPTEGEAQDIATPMIKALFK